jgi:hypothetical protein
MKRFILYFGAFLVVFLPLVANLVHPQAAYAYSSAAVTDCKKQEAGGTAGNVKSCEQGYDGGVTKEAKKTACPDSMGQGSRDPNSLSQAQCFVGYADGYAAASAPTKPPIKPPSNPSQAAQDACNSAESGSAPAIAACEIGFDGGTNSSKDAVCAYLGTSSSRGATVGTAADCGVGWDAANGNLGDSRGTQSNTAAGQSCIAQGFSDGTGTYNACANAYIAQVAGKTEDQACNTTKYPNASNLAACKKGWEQAQTDASATTSKQLGCEAQLTNPLTWIICPVVEILSKVVNWIDGLITDQLNVKTSAIFCDTGTCTAYYTAWQSFRNIALGLMVIAGLVMIIAQALGLEILDAYTIRKILPRLLVAAIGITLSWPLMRFLIQLSDDLGFGVRHLIYAPFANLSDTVDLSFGGGIVGSLFGAGAGAVGTVVAVPAWILLGGPAALLAYVGTAALAVFVAIVVLILRQVAIILLMLLAPLALVAYILPNTQRIYRLWWESFSKALLMFPLIAAFIAVGRVFSAIAVNNGTAVNQLIGFVAYFAPYFMIPLTFRMAGGTVSAMGNLVQSRAQGGFSALQGLRANQRKNRLERARGAGLYRKKTGLTGKLNTIGAYTLDADETMPYLAGTKGGPVGRALFGRMAAEGAGARAHLFTEQTVKGAELANLHYSAAWGAMGKRNKLKDGMTETGLAAMDAKYGIDEDGNKSSVSGKDAVSWKPPANAKYHDLVAYGTMLSHGSISGSQAQYGGEQLVEKAGTLSSFGNTMETQRATLQSVAALSAARDGKLSAGEISDIHNQQVLQARENGSDPTQLAFAADQMAQLEQVSTQQRQDLRRGKGIRMGTDGLAYSVYSKKVLAEGIDTDGNRQKNIAAYQTKEAQESLLTAKANSIGMGKGEYYDETGQSYIFHGGSTESRPKTVLTDKEGGVVKDEKTGRPIETTDVNKLTPEQRELRKTLAVQAGIYGGGDPGAKVKLEKLMDTMGIDSMERQQYMSEYRAREAAGLGGEEPPTEPSAP